MSIPTVTKGIYRHFKGNKYQVFGVAQMVGSNELYVLYRPLYGDREMVLRPYEEFIGYVHRDGREQKRFEFISEQLEPDESVEVLAAHYGTCR